jgi:hypothetical protein
MTDFTKIFTTPATARQQPSTPSITFCVSRSTTIWAVDLAGAQHDQHIPVVSFAEYVKVYVAEILETRPFGTNAN